MYVARAKHEGAEPPASGPALRDLLLARSEPVSRDREASVPAATLLSILDALPVSACIVDGAGHVVLANARGRRAIAEATLDVRSVLEGEADPASVTIHALPAGVDGGARTLLLVSEPVASVATRLARAAARWKLTTCQARILGMLVHGEANKTIAAASGCAVRTVEVHVTAALKKSGTLSRAELIARFWTLQ
jgi:DNA-binding CsgD family transcriptional regulator